MYELGPRVGLILGLGLSLGPGQYGTVAPGLARTRDDLLFRKAAEMQATSRPTLAGGRGCILYLNPTKTCLTNS